MALKIHLKKDQQVVVNGAVIENTTGKNISLTIKNEASILRSCDILTPEGAVTPASRAYYALQCLYLFPARAEHYLPIFNSFIESYVAAAPSGRTIAAEVVAAVTEMKHYAALKLARRLIEHEGKVLAHAQQQLSQQLRRAARARQSEGDGGVGPDPAGLADEGQQVER